MADLPPAIQSFLDENYAGYQVEEAELETLCTGEEVYEIELEDGNDEFEIAVSTEGVLVFTEYEISKNDLPAAVSDNLTVAYPGGAIKEAERIELADGTLQYEVEIKQAGTSLDVLLQSDGTVICEESDQDGEE